MSARAARLGDRITLHYRLACAGQEVVDTFPEGPETFTLGSGEIDPRLETVLTGLTAGEHHVYNLEPWQAFGERDEALVQSLPRSDLPPQQALPVGHRIDFTLPNGQTLTGTLLDVNEEAVRVDFNHPLAGLNVELEVQVIDVQPPDLPERP